MRLTAKQKKLCRAIEGFNILGQNPSHQELSAVLGVTQPAVTAMVKTLVEKGAIQKVDTYKRTLKLLVELDN
tara:strand:- start:416 stop:631 length:216 start_codon:yes stop_codon:yes gene_type:complete